MSDGLSDCLASTPTFSGATEALLTVNYKEVEGCETPVTARKDTAVDLRAKSGVTGTRLQNREEFRDDSEYHVSRLIWGFV